MLKRLLALALFLTFAATSAVCQTAKAQIPAPVGYVNDFARLLTPVQVAELEQILRDYEKQTTNEVVVVTLGSLFGREVSDVALIIGREWKIGKKGPSSLGGNNGVVILLAPNEREVRIEVGTGLEGDLTDLASGRIIDESMIPHLSRGGEDWYAAIKGGVTGVIKKLGTLMPEERRATAAREAAERERALQKTKDAVLGFFLVVLGLAILATLIAVPVSLVRRRRRLKMLDAGNRAALKVLSKELSDVCKKSCISREALVLLLPTASKSDVDTVNVEGGKLSQAVDSAESAMASVHDALESGWRNSQNVRVLLAQAETAIQSARGACGAFETLRIRYTVGRTEGQVRLTGALSRIAEAEKAVSAEDVDGEIRSKIGPLKGLYQRGRDLWKSHEFLELLDVLSALEQRAGAIQVEARESIEFLARARREGNEIFASLRGRVELARQEQDHADVSSKTKELFKRAVRDDYTWLSSRCGGSQPTCFPTERHTFRKILDLVEKLDLVIASAKREKSAAEQERAEAKRRKANEAAARARASAESSRRSSGGGFGGFGGGGGFSGGGAGRRF